MNIRDLEYIVAVHKTGHFSRAAELCAISQPTLSSQIKKLEDYLEVEIFRRSKSQGKVLPTAVGEKIIAQALIILKHKDMIRKIAKQTKDPFSGDLRIGAFPTLAPYYLPTILPKFRETFPELKFYIIEEKTSVLLSMLEEDRVDLIFLATPIDTNYEAIPLFFESFYTVVSIHHPLAIRNSIEPQDILEHNLLLLEEGHCLQTQTVDFCHLIGKSDFDDFKASSPEMLLEMIRMNTGISIMPKSMMNRMQKDIKFIPFSDSKIGRTIAMVFKKKTLHPKLKEKILQIIQD